MQGLNYCTYTASCSSLTALHQVSHRTHSHHCSNVALNESAAEQPSAVWIDRLRAGLSVGQHLLAAYLKSLRAVLRVQFTHKGLRGGRSGVARLVEESSVVQVAPLETKLAESCCGERDHAVCCIPS